ncbi:MAG: hypothetical protein ACHQUC_08700 [Chlamydiales bacterium]
MAAKGIRILDSVNNAVSVELAEILVEIPNGNSFYWSILFLAGTGLFRGKSIPDLELEINDYSEGLSIKWDELKFLESISYKIEDLVLIGCMDQALLKRYDKDQEMYETCDIVIVMFDSCYWEVFSKDEQFIQRLAAKFKDIKFLESDFQKDFEKE